MKPWHSSCRKRRSVTCTNSNLTDQSPLGMVSNLENSLLDPPKRIMQDEGESVQQQHEGEKKSLQKEADSCPVRCFTLVRTTGCYHIQQQQHNISCQTDSTESHRMRARVCSSSSSSRRKSLQKEADSCSVSCLTVVPHHMMLQYFAAAAAQFALPN